MDLIPNALGARLYGLDRDALAAMCEALCTDLEKHGGYHGGIRPENIGYDESENVTLGAPARTGTRDWSTEELEFMAPEVFWSGELAASADVYSLGLLLYAGVTGGLLPFYPAEPTPNDRAAALRRRMNGEPLPMPKAAGRELADIIQKATQFRAEDRYQTPGELAEALRQYRADLRTAMPTAQEMFDKPEQELSDVERMMLGILSEKAAKGEPVEEAEAEVGEEITEVVEEAAESDDITVEVVELNPEPAPLDPEVEEAAAAIERRSKSTESRAAAGFIPEAPEEAQPQPDTKRAPVKAAAPDTPEIRSDKAQDKNKITRQISIIVILAALAVGITALILHQLGYLGGERPAKASPAPVESVMPVESMEPDASAEPVEPSTEPTPTPTPEPKESTYEIVMSDASWETAKAEAEAKGGHLVVIDSAEELQKVAQLAAEKGATYVWLGLRRVGSGEPAWVVDTDSPVYNWASGEPSVYDTNGTAENYVLLRSMNGGWYYNDIMNDPAGSYPAFYSGRLAYVIEYEG